jgi:membrane protease YdiL (CAAX protease family)
VLVSLTGIGAMLAATLGASSLLPLLGFRGFLVLCEAALLFPAAVALLALRPSTWRSTLAWSNPGRATLLLCVGLGATLWIASLGLLELQYTVWPPAPGYIEGFRRLHELLRPKDPLDALASLLAIAVVPALCEEALIRGLLLPSLRLQLPAALSIGLSALLFSFMHDAYRMPFTFAVGLALGALRLRSGSLLPSMVAHASLNALTFAAAPFLDDPTGPLPDPRPLLGVILLTAGLVTSALAWRALPKKHRLTASPVAS